jgi:hypothetical protein
VVLVIKAQDSAMSAPPFDLGQSGVAHPVWFPLRGARASQKAYQLADDPSVRHQGDAATRVCSGKGPHRNETATAELAVAFAPRPAKPAVRLPLVGVPQIRIQTLDSIQGHPIQRATVDLLKPGAAVN